MNSIEPIHIPGFVDLQVNGYLGTDFSSPNLTRDSLAAACSALLDHGTAAFLPTMVSSAIEVYERNLDLIAEVAESDAFRGMLLGIHLEGPFISGQPGFVGTHDPGHVRKPDASLLRRMQQWARGKIRLLTLAAELPGAEDLAHCARELGIVVSVGHSASGQADLERLASAGATALTHLGNGLPNTLPRHDNPIWAGLANDNLTAMIIVDGHHLPDYLIKVLLRAKDVAASVVVSDVCPIAGLPPGEYDCFGSRVVLEESGRVYNPARDCLAGSGMPMLQAMNHLASQRFLSERELLALGFHNPLRLIGVDPTALRAETRWTYDRQTARFSLYR